MLRGGFEPFFDGGGDLERVFVAGAVDIDDDGGAAVEAGEEVDFLEAVDDGGDVLDEETTAVWSCQDGDFLEFCGGVLAGLSADEDFAGFGAERAAGEVEGRRADGGGDLVEGQAVTAERVFGDLDGDLMAFDAGEFDLSDIGEGFDGVADLFGDGAEVFVVGAGRADGDRHDLGLDGDDLDDRFFGAFGEIADAIDAGFDAVGDFLLVEFLFDLDDDDPDGFVRATGEPFDAIEPLDGFFDGDADPFFDFLGGRVRIGDRDRDDVGSDLREDFLTLAEP